MAIRNIKLPGATTNWSDGEVLYALDLNGTLDATIDISPPVGGIISWAKTFDTHDSGTTTSTTADKLVETGQNFDSTVVIGDVVHNTTDDTFAYVTAIDSATTLSIDSDIMASGETYIIYATPVIPNNYAECNGSVISDSDSPFNGATLPDLNSANNRFLRGNISSGATGGSETHNHQFFNETGNGVRLNTSVVGGSETDGSYNSAGSVIALATSGGLLNGDYYTTAEDSKPPYYEIVWIMRIK